MRNITRILVLALFLVSSAASADATVTRLDVDQGDAISAGDGAAYSAATSPPVPALGIIWPVYLPLVLRNSDLPVRTPTATSAPTSTGTPTCTPTATRTAPATATATATSTAVATSSVTPYPTIHPGIADLQYSGRYECVEITNSGGAAHTMSE